MVEQRCGSAHLDEARVRLVRGQAVEQVEGGSELGAGSLIVSRPELRIPLCMYQRQL